ncbi:PH domain-containing protein [Prevotella sp.]|uniref:PH domain-containing protein n=1 Tax=Prevotella sp. TaxID=59823 RepID=UPI00266BA42D
MNRSFHYRASWLNYTCIIVVAVAAMYSLWHRSVVNAIVGFLLMGVVVLMIERIIHTVYVLTSDGRLIISRGRFSREMSVPVNEIIRMSVIRPKLLGVRYILIEYGAGHETTVQPVNEEAFMREVRDRQERVCINEDKDEEL